MTEREPKKENSKICSSCGQPINMDGNFVIYRKGGHYFHEDHFPIKNNRTEFEKGMDDYHKRWADIEKRNNSGRSNGR